MHCSSMLLLPQPVGPLIMHPNGPWDGPLIIIIDASYHPYSCFLGLPYRNSKFMICYPSSQHRLLAHMSRVRLYDTNEFNYKSQTIRWKSVGCDGLHLKKSSNDAAGAA